MRHCRRAALLWLAVPLAASAHLMPPHEATINVVDHSCYIVVAVPAAALTHIDADHNGLLSLDELRTANQQIVAQFERGWQLRDGASAGHILFTYVLAPEGDATPAAGTSYVVIMQRLEFKRAPRVLQLETHLFGSVPEDRVLTLRTTQGQRSEVLVLSPQHSQQRLLQGPPGVAAATTTPAAGSH